MPAHTARPRLRALVPAALLASSVLLATSPRPEPELLTPSLAASIPETAPDPRLDWWREARFGMFIHWGLYAVPAGEWNGNKDHGEWIMNTAHIPVPEYEKFVGQFNPTKFDANAWVKLAKEAGMKYIVITSKHHDGFNLFDSSVTDYDVMSTPFKRDIMKEMADACRKEGIKICWYHSIMDWHHPDYTPRREWETRSTDGANFDRYVTYLKAELKDLLTNYGPIGVLWFDGQWEGTWNNERGKDLEKYVRSLQPNIIINSRVGRGGGAYGLESSENGGALGDYGTPEQFIPDENPGFDWETCMTMNDHWGYNRVDKNFKSAKEMIQNLADIASKGGNYLLNVGPTALGEIPPESVERLHAIGAWTSVNGESVYGTQAGPFGKFSWGRCTQKQLPGGITRLYFHVFDKPASNELVIDGLLNGNAGDSKATLLGDPGKRALAVKQSDYATTIALPADMPKSDDSVIVLDLKAKPDVSTPPTIKADADIFVGSIDATIATAQSGVELRYTLDGSKPTASSPVAKGPVHIAATSTLTAQSFRGQRAVSAPTSAKFSAATPRPAVKAEKAQPGVSYEYAEGDFDLTPDFDKLKPAAQGVAPKFEITSAKARDKYAFRFRGYVNIPADGVYTFSTLSDDGSNLWIGTDKVVANDGPHSAAEKSGTVALAKGLHPVTVTYFEKTGGTELKVLLKGPGMTKQEIPASMLSH